MNMNDIVERALSGILVCVPIGIILFVLQRWFS